MDKNNINTLQKEFIGNIANKESLGNDLGVKMLEETVWGMKSKQDRENMLDNLDEEMVLTWLIHGRKDSGIFLI